MLGRRRDPWWDLEGRGARRRRLRQRVVAALAFVLAVVACIGAGVGWVRQVSAASVTVDLDQWASLDRAWQNGNLNGNNARYPEGGVIPFRLAIEGLRSGEHRITISYDFTASGHKAYDFLATWNATHSPPLCGAGGGAVSSLCPSLPAASSHAFPSDGFAANGLSVSGAQVWSGASRRLTIFGGTILGISGPTHAGNVNGNSTAAFTVRFTSRGDAVLLAWGGHLAQSSYWDTASGGPKDGAAMVSGAPWHMRTLNLDGGGARNQDRSIQPSAVVGELPPFALAPPTPAPATPRPAAPTPRPAAPIPRPSPGATPAPARPGAPAAAPPDGTPTLTGSGRPRPTVPPTATSSVSPGDGPDGSPHPGFLFAGILAALAAWSLAVRRGPEHR